MLAMIPIYSMYYKKKSILVAELEECDVFSDAEIGEKENGTILYI